MDVIYRLLPRFTEVGFEVVDTPEHVRDLLYHTVQHEIDTNWEHIPLENLIDVVYTPIRSKFVDMRGVDRDVMNELTAFHEEWAGGIKLKPTSSYGVRLYQNGSSLAFHYDKVSTTSIIISIIRSIRMSSYAYGVMTCYLLSCILLVYDHTSSSMIRYHQISSFMIIHDRI